MDALDLTFFFWQVSVWQDKKKKVYIQVPAILTLNESVVVQ